MQLVPCGGVISVRILENGIGGLYPILSVVYTRQGRMVNCNG
jgi:hypothetical protein